MIRIKRQYWALWSELRQIWVWFVCEFPCATGVWLRARYLPRYLKSLGKDTVIQRGLRVSSASMVSIGSHCNFAEGVFITGGGGVAIGNWVGLGPDVKIWSVNHRFDEIDRPWMLQGYDKKPVVIEDDVWLAANVFVMPGTTIGRGAVIAACSVVNKSVPAYALFSGNPGRVIGWRKHPDEHQPAADPLMHVL